MVTLTRVEDPAITEFERIITTSLVYPCSFMYANLFESNFGLDQLEDVKFPVFIYLADDKSKYRVEEYGMQTREISIRGFMITKIDNPTTDYSSSDVNPDINKMRQLVENLVYNLNKSTLSIWGNDKDKGGVDGFTCENVYQKADAHLFGVAVEFSWKIKTSMGNYTS